MAIYNAAYDRLDACLKERMRFFRNPAMVVALTNSRRTVYQSALGYTNLDSKEPVRPDHLFAIGSIGKVFTGIAIMQESEARRLDLRAPVTEYLPWFQVRSKHGPITLHHLLTHSSGLPRGTDVSPDPRGEVYQLRELEAGFAPGAHFYYSDLGYKVLGLVLEAVTGQPYPEVIRRGILEPLGMEHTHAAITSAVRPLMVTGYSDLYDDRPAHASRPLVPAPWVETNSGDGSIVSTGEDMARLARMLLKEGEAPHGRLLSSDSYQKLVRPMIEDEGEAYSYGLYVFEDDGFRHAGHGGDIPGYESYLWLDNGLGTVVLMSQPYTPRASFITLEFFRAAALGLALPETPPLPDYLYVSNPAIYAGDYSDAEGRSISFEAREHHLLLRDGDACITLEMRSEDSFYAPHPDWDLFFLRFGRNEAGQVVEVTWGQRWLTNDRYRGPRLFEIPPSWQAYAGHYRSHNPWETNFRVFPRKEQLILAEPNGDEEPLIPLAEGVFRIGEEEYIPERLVFDQYIEGQTLRAVRSGCPYNRFFTA